MRLFQAQQKLTKSFIQKNKIIIINNTSKTNAELPMVTNWLFKVQFQTSTQYNSQIISLLAKFNGNYKYGIKNIGRNTGMHKIKKQTKQKRRVKILLIFVFLFAFVVHSNTVDLKLKVRRRMYLFHLKKKNMEIEIITF